MNVSTYHLRQMFYMLLLVILYATPSLGQRVFRLRVLSPAEQPVASASVRVECCRDTIYLGKTDPAGIFTAGVPRGVIASTSGCSLRAMDSRSIP